MPDDDKGTGVDLDQYQKEKKEFSDAIDEVFAEEAKTDDEIIKSMDDKHTDDGTGEASGDATKDSKPTSDAVADPDKDKTDDLFTSGQPDSGVEDDTADKDATADTDSGETDWQKKAEEAETKLQKEQHKTASWGGRITKANQRVIELGAEVERLQKDSPAKDPDTESDKDVLDRFRSDFPELAEVVDVLQKRIDGNKPAEQDKEPDTVSAPTDAETETTPHMETIRNVHKDLDEMVQSGVLLTWINNQADFMRPHLETIYRTGNAKQVIDMVSRFKESSGWKSQLEKQGDSKNKSKQEKLDALKEVNSEGSGPPASGPDKNDYEGAAKEAGL